MIPEGTSTSDINRMVMPISGALVEMMPYSLFRYRSCNEKHIDAFEKDRIYMVPSEWFNDPYDTLVRFDNDGIKRYVESLVSIEGLKQLKEFFAQGNDLSKEFKMMLPDDFWEALRTRVLEISDFSGLEEKLEESKQHLLTLVSTYFPLLSIIGKRFSTVACFSEDVQSILMWSHYADSHRGFALEYDFRPTLLRPLPHIGLYPVIYSEDRFDASPFLLWGLFTILGIKTNNPDGIASIKAALYKSKMWEYEKEWRMIDPGPHDIQNPAPTEIEYRPVAIYYGQNISPKDKARLHKIALEKGIKEYEMFIDSGAQKYEMLYRPLSGVSIQELIQEEHSIPFIIDTAIIDDLSAQAKSSPRLRMNLDLRNSPEDQSQRMLNALEPGTVMPIHRHMSSSETVVCLRGHFEEYFYDENGNLTETIDMVPGGVVVNVPIGQWHSLKSLESGTVLLECKDGKWAPLGEDEIMVK